MNKEKRKELLLELLRSDLSYSISDIAKRFNVSDITIRRDFKELTDEGLIKKPEKDVYQILEPEELPILHRMNEEREAKEQIALAASKLITNDQSIFVGSGSTTFCLAKYLLEKNNLTVVTNAINLGFELAKGKNLTVVVVGGVLRPSELSLIGHITNHTFKQVFVDKVFVGMAAISPEAGLTNEYLLEVGTDREIFDLSAEIIVLADHTKFGKVSSSFVAPIEKIHTLITDEKTDKKILQAIQDKGVKVIIAEARPKEIAFG